MEDHIDCTPKQTVFTGMNEDISEILQFTHKFTGSVSDADSLGKDARNFLMHLENKPKILIKEKTQQVLPK